MKHYFKKLIYLLLAVFILCMECQHPILAAENGYTYLHTPTQIIKINNTYYIVDCYHDQIIYTDNLNTELRYWKVMTRNLQKPHALASDGEIYMVADTDNNRVLTFSKNYDSFRLLQTFEQVGTRPHYVDYNHTDETFYVWSSLTGEMYLYKKTPGTKSLTLQEIKSIPALKGCYARSFTITGDTILFPVVERSSILAVDKNSFEIIKEYPVPDSMAGMVQVNMIDGYYFITVSTDRQYDSKGAAIVRAQSLEDFSTGNFEELSSFFGNDGTPYYVSYFDGAYYMIYEGTDPHVYRFHAENGAICNVQKMF